MAFSRDRYVPLPADETLRRRDRGMGGFGRLIAAERIAFDGLGNENYRDGVDRSLGAPRRDFARRLHRRSAQMERQFGIRHTTPPALRSLPPCAAPATDELAERENFMVRRLTELWPISTNASAVPTPKNAVRDNALSALHFGARRHSNELHSF
jgi:hypothetical protein